MREKILAFFRFLSQCWTVFKKPKPNDVNKSKKGTILIEMKNINVPNPSSDQPSDNGPTISQSYGSKIAQTITGKFKDTGDFSHNFFKAGL